MASLRNTARQKREYTGMPIHWFHTFRRNTTLTTGTPFCSDSRWEQGWPWNLPPGGLGENWYWSVPFHHWLLWQNIIIRVFLCPLFYLKRMITLPRLTMSLYPCLSFMGKRTGWYPTGWEK